MGGDETLNFQWRCTPSSSDKGIISVLAVVETIAAVGGSIWVAVHFQTVSHIVLAALLAPLLLLRTEESMAIAFSWFDYDKAIDNMVEAVYYTPLEKIVSLFDRNCSRFESLPARVICALSLAFVMTIAFVPVFVCLALTILAARVFATGWTLISNIKSSLAVIPTNWKRVCLCTDVCHPPEVLPGAETREPQGWIEKFSVSDALYAVRNETSFVVRMFVGMIIVAVLIPFVWIPSYLYRMSLKATSIVYLPFLFIVSSGMRDQLSAAEYIEDRRSGSIERLQWWYSALVIAGTLGVFVIVSLPGFYLRRLYMTDGVVWDFLREYYIPSDGDQLTIKGWHVARLANSAIVIWLFYFAGRAERRLANGRWTGESIVRKFELWKHLQIVLTIYTIFCAQVWLIKYAISMREIPFAFELLP